MTRSEHLEWAKSRAFEYLNKGDMKQAFLSFAGDMRRHEEYKVHFALDAFCTMYFGQMFAGVEDMRKFIEDFD